LPSQFHVLIIWGAIEVEEALNMKSNMAGRKKQMQWKKIVAENLSGEDI